MAKENENVKDKMKERSKLENKQKKKKYDF